MRLLGNMMIGLLLAPCIQAATLEWPGMAPCAGTLQACINGAGGGDTIAIAALAPVVSNDILITKSLTLTSGPAARAAFHHMAFNIEAIQAGGQTVTLHNLSLENSRVFVLTGNNDPLDTHRVHLQQIRLRSPAGMAGIAVSPLAVQSQQSLQIEWLDYSGDMAMEVSSGLEDTGLQIGVRNSYFRSNSGVLPFLSWSSMDPGARLDVVGNRFERLSADNADCVRLSTTAQTTVSGLADAHIDRNDFIGCRTAAAAMVRERDLRIRFRNNTVVRGVTGFALADIGGGNIDWRIANNILADNAAPFAFSGLVDTLATRSHNLYWNNASPPSLGFEPSAVLDPPAFVSAGDPRLTLASAAIDAGNNADNPSALGAFDFDGQPLIVGGSIDIGAHEFTDALSSLHHSTSDNNSSNHTTLDAVAAHPDIDLPQVMPVAGLLAAPVPVWAGNVIGLYDPLSPRIYRIFNQDQVSTMLPDQTWFALRVGGRDNTLLHTASTSNNLPLPNVTRLDHPQLNNNPVALPLVTQRWNPGGGSGVYNNSAVGVWYTAGRWHVFNQGPSPQTLPNGSGFHVLIPSLSILTPIDYAFRLNVSSTRAAMEIDHPRSNNRACAQVYASALFGDPFDGGVAGVYVPAPLAVSYAAASNGGGRWVIRRADNAGIAAGSAFHVYVDPVSSRSCEAEKLFADGFE